MYLMKQLRESRIIAALALLGLLLLGALVAKGMFLVGARIGIGRGTPSSGLDQSFVFFFYLQAVLIGCWGWLLGSIGIGKNLGEDGGSFLLTRPRTRAWFIWRDWAYGMVWITGVTAVSEALLSVFCRLIIQSAGIHPAAIAFPLSGQSVPLLPMAVLTAAGVWLFAGLVYSFTYFSTIVARRSSGVILGAGSFVGYLVLRALIAHYFPAVQLPSPFLGLFDFQNNQVYGLSNHLALWITVRALVVLLFPVAAQIVLSRAEI
jgi:hypothetical protein